MPSADTPIIPRTALFGDPDRTLVRLSPDGRYIAFLAPHNGVPNVWLAETATVDQARPLTDFNRRGVAAYGWAYSSRHLLFIRDENGDENWHIAVINLDDGSVRDVTPFANVQARLVAGSPDFPRHVLIALNHRLPQLHDVYRLDIETGDLTLVEENPGFMQYIADAQLRLQLAQAMQPDGSVAWLRPAADGGWQVWQTVPQTDTLTTAALNFDATGQALYLLDSRARDTAALLALDLATDQQTLLAEDPHADAGSVLTHPVTQRVQAVAFTHARKQWRVLDSALADDFAYLQTALGGEIEISSRSDDDRLWVVFEQHDAAPGAYHLYNRGDRALTYLFGNRAALVGARLAAMHCVTIDARDGLALVGYLSLPPDVPAHGGIPTSPQPLVLVPHGGPWARDVWGFNSWHQWLANRGYAVLSVNFRSSTGFGKAFVNAGDNQWGEAIIQDQADAVQWAIDAGIADPTKVAIVGGSFGGYSALAGLTFFPDLYACAVSIVGPSNLQTLIDSLPPYWAPIYELFAKRMGDPRTDAGRAQLQAHSPLTHVARIRRPLLIGQGANDPRVKQAESDQIVAAMQARNIPVTYVLYPDEGHGFGRAVNRYSFYAITEAFLAHWLGGRVEPPGDALAAGSQQVMAGGELIPGLAATL